MILKEFLENYRGSAETEHHVPFRHLKKVKKPIDNISPL